MCDRLARMKLASRRHCSLVTSWDLKQDQWWSSRSIESFLRRVASAVIVSSVLLIPTAPAAAQSAQPFNPISRQYVPVPPTTASGAQPATGKQEPVPGAMQSPTPNGASTQSPALRILQVGAFPNRIEAHRPEKIAVRAAVYDPKGLVQNVVLQRLGEAGGSVVVGNLARVGAFDGRSEYAITVPLDEANPGTIAFQLVFNSAPASLPSMEVQRANFERSAPLYVTVVEQKPPPYPQNPSPPSTPQFPQPYLPKILQVGAFPNRIEAGRTEKIAVRAAIYDPKGLVQTVLLQRLGDAGGSLGNLSRLGGIEGRSEYAITIPFNEANPGTIALQLVLNLAPVSLPSMEVQRPNFERSVPLYVTVLEQKLPPPPSLPPPPPPQPVNIPQPPPPPDMETRQDLGLQIAVPKGWSADESLRELHGPMNINTFGSQYLHGGFIPAGNASIDVTSVRMPRNFEDYVRAQLEDSSDQFRQVIRIAGLPATEVMYTDKFSPGTSYRNTAVFIPRGGRLYKLFLTYNAGDANPSRHEDDFRQVLSSLQFIP
jgi:hypothetical protein